MESKNLNNMKMLNYDKPYEALSNEEKKELSAEGINDQAYEILRQNITLLKKEQTISPDPNVKEGLMKAFQTNKNQIKKHPLAFEIPAYAAAIALLILASAGWFFRPIERVIIEKEVLVEVPSLSDTVFVYTPPDTVFIEKKIRVNVPVYIKVQNEEKLTPVMVKGKDLSESEELMNLLVTGNPV